jgi:dipeptidyl-peptidase-4
MLRIFTKHRKPPGLATAIMTSILLATGGPALASKPEKIGWIEPVKRDIRGWTVHVDPQLLSGEHQETGGRALSMLANHLERISILIPEKQLADLRRMEIWIEHEHPELRTMQYHPGADWLIGRGYDPRLAKKVHITRAAELLSRDQMLKHPAVILHELAHAYHDQILGFEDAGILDAYNKAMKAGTYEKVLLFNGNVVKHYATTDQKEYFAEATEAYFYRNDFYPFVRAELQKHDPAGFAEMERVWGGRS